ncbi:hypothetical protein BJ138DRAFT_1077926 [Hygrophoropsis aurantiaca]|uniref:Uncharacterized protein n=1 Tax=Hygrophoropsis aurantiaca TaxID=72124 RepID=A0ACB8AQL9_9AGAM|nr:hypothetical protein BJ138DRAFT_1077926 [Hygrophoropsis aurantiaca]
MASTVPVPEFPPSGHYVAAVKESCSALRQKANISVKPEAIRRLLLSPAFLNSFKRVSVSHGLAFPLKFPTLLSELNFLSILSLLNFASGYRVPLHEQTGRGAWDNIRAFTFSLFISSATGSGSLLSAAGMQTISEQQVAEIMGVSVHIERPHETIPGVTVGELSGPMFELVRRISATLKETGEVLQQAGYPDLGSFVAECLKERSSGTSASLDATLEKLVRAIPAFRDMALIDGQAVYCFKKALFLIHAVTIRFGASASPPFPIPDTSQAPVFTDNVLPSLLVHLGVLDLSEASYTLSTVFPDAGSEEKLSTLLAAPPSSDTPAPNTKKAPPKGGPILTSDQAYILRAAAVDACELIVKFAREVDISTLDDDVKWIKDITLPDLDIWLWAVAKDRPDYRKLERFVLQHTVFF